MAVAGVALVGGVLSPVVASAADSSSTVVEATVASVISVSSSATVAISVTPTSGGAEAVGTDTVTVSSNDADGYTLTLANSDGTSTMAGFKDDGVTSNGETLAATGGTFASPAALTTNAWGFRVDDLGTFGANGATTYAPVISGGNTIRDTSATANSQTTTVKYGVKVDLSKPNGIYRDTVTYTATAK